MHLVSSLHLQTQGGRAKNSAASGTCLWSESRGWVPSTALGAVFIVTPGVRTFHLNHNCAPYTRSHQHEIARKSLVSPAGLVGSEWLLIPSRSDNAAFYLHSFTPIFLPSMVFSTMPLPALPLDHTLRPEPLTPSDSTPSLSSIPPSEPMTVSADEKAFNDPYPDFLWMTTEEPHRSRRMAILKTHPEVRWTTSFCGGNPT